MDNRSSSSFDIPGLINFKSGDISGTAAKTSRDRYGRGTEYYAAENDAEKISDNEFADKSAQLRASLNSLALINVAGIITHRQKNINKKTVNKENDTEKKVEPVLTEREKENDNSND